MSKKKEGEILPEVDRQETGAQEVQETDKQEVKQREGLKMVRVKLLKDILNPWVKVVRVQINGELTEVPVDKDTEVSEAVFEVLRNAGKV